MRLDEHETAKATAELLGLLAGTSRFHNVATKDLIGTPRFHGERTLTTRQVAKLLRASGRVGEATYQYGIYQQTRWWLREEKCD